MLSKKEYFSHFTPDIRENLQFDEESGSSFRNKYQKLIMKKLHVQINELFTLISKIIFGYFLNKTL